MTMDIDQYTIKDLENLSGIKAHTIRIWEQRYGFLKPKRTETNIRYYSSEELKTLLNVSLLNKYGYKVSHINKLSHHEVADKVLGLRKSESDHEFVINDLIQTMVSIDPDGFENTLNQQIQTHGLEKTITQYIFPFLERVGFLWATSHIQPGQEHVVSNIIRQKVVLATEKLPMPLNYKNKTICFLPENEYHELGLLFVNYLLKANNVKVVYLGCAVPVADVLYITKHVKPNYLYTHLTSVGRSFNFEKFTNNIHNAMPDIPLIVSGSLVQSYKKKVPTSVHIKESYRAVMDFIASL
jgi:MerR family transcriptional regulator, light-induced transcriptional regulator